MKNMTPFNGDFYDSDGNLRNILEVGEQTEPSPKDFMTPMDGRFYASDGSVHNLDEVGKNALSATKLSTARDILTDLESTVAGSFDGSQNVLVGINGKLPLTNGGTGRDNSRLDVALGHTSLESLTTGLCNVAIGLSSQPKTSTGSYNVAVGTETLYKNTRGKWNTAVGNTALWDLTEAFYNSTGLGSAAQVTGSNQVQLGDSKTTVYCYGSVQDRSDERDKSDIRPTALGLDFINKLSPVDFKWDMREDYFERTVDENGEPVLIEHERDGSKKRNRYHHGLIAQDVHKIMDEMGVDFGGYQDHSVNGGKDVLSIGYTELIAPLIKAVQELSEKNRELQEKIENLESRGQC